MSLQAVARASEKAALALEHRNRLIREATKDHSMRAVAKAAGLSASRVHQILNGR